MMLMIPTIPTAAPPTSVLLKVEFVLLISVLQYSF